MPADRTFALPRGMRHVVAGIATLHGLAHLAGTVVAFRAAAAGDRLTGTGGVTVSDPTAVRVLGVVWALTGTAVVVAAAVTGLGRPQWPATLLGACALSLAVCLSALWDAAIGIPVDLLIGAIALAGLRGRRAYGRQVPA